MEQYQSTKEGKKAFVEERVKPLILSMDDCWEDVTYEVIKGCGEYVTLKNKNPEKTVEVNVTGDSITALVGDIFRKLEGLFYL